MKINMLKTMMWGLCFAALLSCSKENEEENTNPDLPASVSGKVVTLECTFENSGAPYKMGDEATFTFSSSGALFIDVDPDATNGDEIQMNTVELVGKEFVWEDTDGGYTYALSLTAEDSINEINVSDLGGTFYNQFTPKVDGAANLSLIKGVSGTYNVSAVAKGTHSRMTVIIGADGTIDFDTGISFSPSDYALITDRINTANVNAILVDCKPWPDEPYARFTLHVEPGSGTLTGVTYAAEYPNAGGVVEVSF